jgi:prepilin-type N-terminal cleavage/methylation domain-containing protein
MKKKGFTLLELLFGLAICSILLFIGFSSWIHFKQRNEQDLLVNEIITAIHYAKIQAISYGRPLRLSSKKPNADWSSGMNLSLADVDINTEQLLHQWSWKDNNWNVEWVGVKGLNNIIITNTASNAMSNGRFILHNKHSDEKIILILNRLGRVRRV